MQPARFHTQLTLCDDLLRLGLRRGDAVMVHAAMRRVGPLLGGPDALISALLAAVGLDGTIMAYADWDAGHEALQDANGRVPDEWRRHVLPFDLARSRATRDNGILPEFVRTWPGARRSGNPGASMVAVGAKAAWLTADHALDYGYGPQSPLGRLVEAGGRVLLVGAPRDTMTLLHHAEHLADIPRKRIKRTEVPFASPEGTQWRTIEEFDTSDPVVEGLADDYFDEIVTAYLAGGRGTVGRVGDAESVLVDAAPIVRFAVDWLEARFR
jgi:aminoglycoside 3-N-acetyltransferase